MDAGEPRVRHRGFFLHSDTTGENETVEQENPEGFVVRVRIRRQTVARRIAASSRNVRNMRLAGSRSRIETAADEGTPQIRSGSVTGSRQRAHLPR
jgi:hypothetical protein